MRLSHLVITFAAGFAAAFLLLAYAPAEADDPSRSVTPVQTEECVRTNGVGTCVETATSYAVRGGIRCTEECELRDGVGSCRYRGSCSFDQGSGCFVKETCDRLGHFGCDRTREIALCAYQVQAIE